MPTSNRLSTKIRLIMLCLSAFELYSHWVPQMKPLWLYFHLVQFYLA